MHAYITKAHNKTCKTKIVPCPNAGCDTQIQRQRVSTSAIKCPHTVIPCQYNSIGCDTELKKEDIAAREQDDRLPPPHGTGDCQLPTKCCCLLMWGKVICIVRIPEEKRSFREIHIPSLLHPSSCHVALRVYANGLDDTVRGTRVSICTYSERGV